MVINQEYIFISILNKQIIMKLPIIKLVISLIKLFIYDIYMEQL
jgi:hypothetical protein